MFHTKLLTSSRLGQGQVTKCYHAQSIYISGVAHVLSANLQVEYDGNGPYAIRANLGKSRYKVRLCSGQIRSHFDIFIFGKQKHNFDAKGPQESNGTIFCMWAKTSKNRV